MSSENLNKAQYFAHRPPSHGIHLLSDPLPELIARTAFKFAHPKRSAVKRKKPFLKK